MGMGWCGILWEGVEGFGRDWNNEERGVGVSSFSLFYVAFDDFFLGFKMPLPDKS